jgi:hypothetical protein
MTGRITPERVREIVAMEDRPILRNLLITDAYHRLTLAMARLYGRVDFAWPIFAIWASKQAGQVIREEEPRVRLSPRLVARAPEVLDLGRRAPVRAALRRAARHIGGGNTIVFEEIGAMFAGFAAAFAEPARRTEARLADLMASLREGPSMPDRVTLAADGSLIRQRQGGQTLLREALAHYFAALHERDADARAELILLANGLCGLHEQIRLQPYIAGALEAPLGARLREALDETSQVAGALAAVVRAAATQLLMTLTLPGQVLRLGVDVPAPPGRPLWPEPLAQPRHPRLVELAEQLMGPPRREHRPRVKAWLRARGAAGERRARGSGAVDWARLGDRMRYIFAFFRSRQRDASLLASPFSPAQVQALAAGRVPAGPL